MVRVFANGLGDLGSIQILNSIPKPQKMVLDASLLDTQQYKVRIKDEMEQSKERSSACGDLGINSKTPNRILTRRLPDTKCINVSPRIRLHASIWLKIRKKKNNKK